MQGHRRLAKSSSDKRGSSAGSFLRHDPEHFGRIRRVPPGRFPRLKRREARLNRLKDLCDSSSELKQGQSSGRTFFFGGSCLHFLVNIVVRRSRRGRTPAAARSRSLRRRCGRRARFPRAPRQSQSIPVPLSPLATWRREPLREI